MAHDKQSKSDKKSRKSEKVQETPVSDEEVEEVVVEEAPKKSKRSEKVRSTKESDKKTSGKKTSGKKHSKKEGSGKKEKRSGKKTSGTAKSVKIPSQPYGLDFKEELAPLIEKTNVQEMTPDTWEVNDMVQSKMDSYDFDAGGVKCTSYRTNFYQRIGDKFHPVLLQDTYDQSEKHIHILTSWDGVKKYVPPKDEGKKDTGKPERVSYNMSFGCPYPAFTDGKSEMNLDDFEAYYAENGMKGVVGVNLPGMVYMAWKRSCFLKFKDRARCPKVSKLCTCKKLEEVERLVKCPIYIPNVTQTSTDEDGEEVTTTVVDYGKKCYMSVSLDCFTFTPKSKKDDDDKPEPKFVMKTVMYEDLLDADGNPVLKDIDPLSLIEKKVEGYPIVQYSSSNIGSSSLTDKLLLYQLDSVKSEVRAGGKGRPHIGQRARTTYKRPTNDTAVEH